MALEPCSFAFYEGLLQSGVEVSLPMILSPLPPQTEVSRREKRYILG